MCNLPEIRIPVSKPYLSALEKQYVNEAIDSSWISSTGRFIDSFEASFAKACGTRTSIGVCNGTVALHLALMTLDVRPGDEVIVPSLTYIATANAVRYVGAEPVFVDVDPATWTLDPAKLEDAITVRTKGIIPVHLYGHPADMDAINRLAAIHGLWVLEDAAEAPFATYRGRPTGSLASIATFSFYGNKVLTSGEGGAITLNDPQLELRARTLRGQGVDPQRRYYFPVTGYNFRITNLACAVLMAQFERREEILARRRAIYAMYSDELQSVPDIGFQPVAPWATLSPWLFCINVNAGEGSTLRDDLMKFLRENGIDSRPFFIPLHRLPPFREESRRRQEYLPMTDTLANTGLNLPTFPDMTDDDVRFVANAVRAWRMR